MIEKSIFYRNMELLTDKGVKKVHELKHGDSILVVDGTGFVTFTEAKIGYSGTCSHFNMVRSSFLDITLSEWMALLEFRKDGDRLLSAMEIKETLIDKTASIRLNVLEPFVGVTEMPDEFFASAWVYHILSNTEKELKLNKIKDSSRINQVKKLLSKNNIQFETLIKDDIVHFVFDKNFGIRETVFPSKITLFNMMSRRQAIFAIDFENLLLESVPDGKSRFPKWNSDFTAPLLIKAGYSPYFLNIDNMIDASKYPIISTEFWSVYDFENQYEDITIEIDSSIKAIFMRSGDAVVPVQNLNYR